MAGKCYIELRTFTFNTGLYTLDSTTIHNLTFNQLKLIHTTVYKKEDNFTIWKVTVYFVLKKVNNANGVSSICYNTMTSRIVTQQTISALHTRIENWFSTRMKRTAR